MLLGAARHEDQTVVVLKILLHIGPAHLGQQDCHIRHPSTIRLDIRYRQSAGV
jgi:hypothetical protein